MFEELGRSEYRYVVVEGPSLLGSIDGQLVGPLGRRDARRLPPRSRSRPTMPSSSARRWRGCDAPVLGSVVIGGTRVRYSLPAWTPVREKGEVTEKV